MEELAGKQPHEAFEKAFLSLITTFVFILSMVVFYHVMVITSPTSILLQSEAIDMYNYNILQFQRDFFLTCRIMLMTTMKSGTRRPD